MMNSATDSPNPLTLERLLALLDDAHLQRRIDAPLDRAAETFTGHIPELISHRIFHRILSEFIRHIYAKGLPLPHTLSYDQALGEGIFLLESFYQTSDSHGYDGAFLDARRIPPDGIQAVLSELVGIVKANERQKYIRWVVAQWTNGLDWPSRCRITREFLNRYGEYLTPELGNYPPEALTDDLFDLIFAYQATEKVFGQLSAGLPVSFGL